MRNAIALGTFDGLHAGHRAVLAETAGFRTTAVTFRVPPKHAAAGEAGMLMTPEAKCRALGELGIAETVLLDFGKVCGLSPTDFLDNIVGEYSPELIACGFNYRFGSGAAGDAALLEDYCKRHGIEFRCCRPVEENGVVVSSSALREMITQGRVNEANRQIYGGFCFQAPVIHGDRRGRTIGFPTINQDYPELLVRPRPGVYASLAEFDGKSYKGVSNIGLRPTYRVGHIISETYLPEFSGELYGVEVVLRPLRFLRAECEFSSVEELKEAIRRDVSEAFPN